MDAGACGYRRGTCFRFPPQGPGRGTRFHEPSTLSLLVSLMVGRTRWAIVRWPGTNMDLSVDPNWRKQSLSSWEDTW